MLSRVTPLTPTICPVPLSVLRKHAYIVQTINDDLLQMYGNAATAIAENATNRYFLQRTVTWTLTPDSRQPIYSNFGVTLQNYFNSFQRPWLHCPHSASNVASMVIGTWGESDTVLDPIADYQVDLLTDPARIKLLNFAEFAPNADHLTVTYTTGYSTTSDGVPAPIQQAIMLLTTRLYAARGDTTEALWSSGAESLLAPYTVLRFGAPGDLYNA